ncbi:hypothetical protein T07_10198 [Trichinella nelsoni]|uniref:Uncharacterized protein n=1 Tax=Trichinella nelsoni TaxID=6336 RepID=A0A0V0RHN4_9BILA|nr:hypothetical protein T07_10198 [Trichinella nelsoni]
MAVSATHDCPAMEMMEARSKSVAMKIEAKSKKLVANHERLKLLLQYLDQLCAMPAKAKEIEEQILMAKELCHETDAHQIRYG